MDDDLIIELYWNHSEDAIKETVKKYGKLCQYVASNILKDKSDIEECVNDTLFALWNAIPPAKPEKFSSFLCRITRNLALKKYQYIHAKKRNPKVLISLNELEEYTPDIKLELYDDIQISQCINDFLYSIDLDSRNVFIRRYWYFDSIHDIMKHYNMSKSKVESMLFRTRNKLREYLMKEGFDNEFQ